MAGVAPQHRGGGSNATTIGMIVSIVVNVLLLATLIFLFTNQEQLRNNADQADARLKRLAGSGEQRARGMFPDATGNKALIEVMLDHVGALSGAITGNQNDSPQVVRTKIESAVAEIRGANKLENPDLLSSSNGLVAIVNGIHDAYVQQLDKANEQTAALEKAQGELAAIQEALKASQDAFAVNVSKLNEVFARVQQSKKNLEETKNSDIATLRQMNEAKNNQITRNAMASTAARRDLVNELEQRDATIRLQMRALGDVKGPPPTGAQPLAMARTPIGRVLRALPGDSLVHIDRGEQDGVNLGMTFAVYHSGQRVSESGRGKANIEVVSVGETTAECRIITPPSPDDPIIEGDSVGNIVLSRLAGRKTRFCVVGEFDIDGDGIKDPRGLDAIIALVAQYGGEVVHRVDATTDFLIVGMEPAENALASFAPPAAANDEFDDESMEGDEDDFDDENDDEFDEGEDDEESDDEFDDENGDEEDDDGEDEDDDEDDEDDDEDDEDDDDDDEFADASDATAEAPPAAGPQPFGRDHTAAPSLRRALADSDTYALSIRHAGALAIPRLTLNQFLNFVGLEQGPAVLRQLGLDQ